MNRGSLLLVACLVACGGSKPNNKNLAPLPPDKPVAEMKPTEEKKPDVAPVAAKPMPPLEVKFERPGAAVKLVNAGKGKKSPLRYTPKAGTKQAIEFEMTFGQSAKAGDESVEQQAPTIVLAGEAEAKAVDGTKTDYTLAMSSVTLKPPADMDAEVASNFKIVTASLGKLVISGTVDGGAPTPQTLMRIETPDQYSAKAIDLLRITLPPWPVFPSEPIGLGAKWQTTRSSQLALGPGVAIEMKHVTDYELVAKKGTTWTIKTKTMVSGTDQEVKTASVSAKVSQIGGTGTQEITLDDGTMFPSYSSKIESNMTVTEPNKPAETHGFKIASTVTAKAK